jgi:hypothetical protein
MLNVYSAIESNDFNVNAIKDTLATEKAATALNKVLLCNTKTFGKLYFKKIISKISGAEEEEEPGCNEVNNCHVNAACTADESSGRYVCVCRSGFNGNGFHCEPSVIGCNVINNCHRDAQCLYDPESIGYRCKCKEV